MRVLYKTPDFQAFDRLGNLCERSCNAHAMVKEVIQPQVPLRLPCYDFTPVMNHKVVSAHC